MAAGTPTQFLGRLFVRDDPIMENVGVKLLKIFNDHGVPNCFSFAIEPFVPTKQHAKTCTESQVHR